MIKRITHSIGFRAMTWYQPLLLARRHDAVRCFFKQSGDVHSYTTPDELLLLAAYAGHVRSDSAIVEIGSYVGASTRYLVHGSRQAKSQVICIDTWMNETMPSGMRNTCSEFVVNLEPHMDRIKLLRGDSAQFSSEDIPASIGLAFIDADHSYEAVKRDLALVGSKIIDGGYIAFHDIAAFQGVSRCVGELLSDGKHRIVDHVNNLVIIQNMLFDK